MSWKTVTLTTAENIQRVAFAGRGSIYVEGTFGGGTVRIKPIAVDDNVQVVATGFLYEMDGSTTKSADVPAGHYELELNGSAGATVLVFYGDQQELVRG